MEDNKARLAEQLYFSKEAAEYLGISPQRLNQLIKEGKLNPLKKNSSGTIFHIDELKKRKDELSSFNSYGWKAEKGTFIFDSDIKREALNYAVLLNVTGMSEKKLEPLFEAFSKSTDVTRFLTNDEVISQYSEYFGYPVEMLKVEFDRAYESFCNLRETDDIIKRGDLEYPKQLAKTEQAPRFIYIRGKRELLQENRTVALAGSRKASERAINNTARLAKKLGENGIVIVSGLAKGIDAAAHMTALNNDLNTIAVIGTNLNCYYPSENKEIQEQIEDKGLVISQFSPAQKTERWFFPLRNGVMSGLSLATVIMEAGETSGSLKQADFALKQNRLVIIPSSAMENQMITWSKRYVQRGAKVANTPSDVIDILKHASIFEEDEIIESKHYNVNNGLSPYLEE